MKFVYTLFIVALLASGIFAVEKTKPVEPGEEMGGIIEEVPLDLKIISIKSPVAREYFNTDSIRVRNKQTTYTPAGKLPVLKMKTPNEEECRQRLGRILEAHGGRKANRIKELGGALATRLEDASCWIHPASGGYKFTVTRNTTEPTQIKDFKEAVQLCLEHVAKYRLVEMLAEEEIDILTVSTIRNVVSEVEVPEKPLENFVSDYYVEFGRRYMGVPIIGSYLTLRIDCKGEVVMVQRNWRKIVAAKEEEAIITEKPLRELIFNSPGFREEFRAKKIQPENINISQISAGYIEAPFDFAQEHLRPGCLVHFWVGESRDEMDSELLLPLEDEGNVDLLLGKRMAR